MGSSACEPGVEGDVCEQVRRRLKLWDRSGSPGSAPEVSLGKCANLGLHMTHVTPQGPGMAPIRQDITRQWAENRVGTQLTECDITRQQKPPGSSSSPLVEGQTLPLGLIDSWLPFLSLLGSPATTYVGFWDPGWWWSKESFESYGFIISKSSGTQPCSPALGLGFQQRCDQEHRWGGPGGVQSGDTWCILSIARAGFICHSLPFTNQPCDLPLSTLSFSELHPLCQDKVIFPHSDCNMGCT